jgi:hypothetical protein
LAHAVAIVDIKVFSVIFARQSSLNDFIRKFKTLTLTVMIKKYFGAHRYIPILSTPCSMPWMLPLNSLQIYVMEVFNVFGIGSRKSLANVEKSSQKTQQGAR